MAIKKLEKDVWQEYFDTFSKSFLKDKQPEYAEIQVLSNTSGVQPETGWLPLEGITYDTRKEMLNVKVEDLDHMIWYPTEIHVDEEPDGWITSIEIKKNDGSREIIEIR